MSSTQRSVSFGIIFSLLAVYLHSAIPHEHIAYQTPHHSFEKLSSANHHSHDGHTHEELGGFSIISWLIHMHEHASDEHENSTLTFECIKPYKSNHFLSLFTFVNHTEFEFSDVVIYQKFLTTSVYVPLFPEHTTFLLRGPPVI